LKSTHVLWGWDDSLDHAYWISRATKKNELMHNQGFNDFDRMQFINPSHIASPNSKSKLYLLEEPAT